MSENSAYLVVSINERYEVQSPTGVNVMVCTNQSSAQHYADILSTAYNAGYKQALRDKRTKPN